MDIMSARSKRSKKQFNAYSSLVYKNKASRERKDRLKAAKMSTPRATATKKTIKTGTRKDARRAKADARARKKAEELAKLPKDPVKRFFARLNPKRLAKFWFSKEGAKMFGKICAAGVLLAIIAVGGLFLYYKKDLDQIKLDEIKVSETVNTYLDRNGEVLWEDKGDGDYRLVVEGDQISTYMRQATVAIEDKNFYNHPGVDWTALIRAGFATLSGQGVQGGSTLTQQLIKQVYFSEDANKRDVSGLPRKVKEVILALEIEKMYDKEQIITMYLNESPYGGRRNGVESAAQTYFGKSAKDLTLAESALIAAIPNNPGVLNPYNEYGNEALLARQQKTLDVMAEMGYITQDEADAAKAENILDTILPETNQYDNMKAPHFVLEVKKELEDKYGVKTMRTGGFTITTTLDLRAQELAETAVQNGKDLMYTNGSDNIALSSVDVETGQVIAMVGSADWNAPVYGEVNAATSPLEPGSSIKPILDYAPLFMERSGTNYGPGSVLKDENIDSLYCAGYTGSCSLRNSSGAFYGDVTIRQSLGNSFNIAAVKALYINGIENSLEIAHKLGDKSYCGEDGAEAGGLSIAIGSGCNVKQVEHANAYASIARGGVYKPLTYVLELKNSTGETVEKWEDTEGERVVDEQVAYLISNILADSSARTLTFGSQATSFGFVVPGVWTGSKTGTTTTANSAVAKDSWMMSFSTAIATSVWNGNHDGGALSSSSNTIVRQVINDYMGPVHTELYASEGKWSSGDQPQRPSGIQDLTVNGKKDIWPSWYNSKNSGTSKESLTFNKYNKKLAADCTPEAYKITVEATKTTDPITKQDIWSVPDGYNREETDDCSYTPPTVSVSYNSSGKVTVTVTKGTGDISSCGLYVNGSHVESCSGTTTFNYKLTGNESSVEVKVSDSAGYEASDKLSSSEIKKGGAVGS